MDVVMPQLGETVAEGTVTRWYKKVGDAVRADEALFDVETDKVSTEIPAPASGVLAEILVQEGVAARVGTRLAVIREGAVTAAAPPVPVAGAPAPKLRMEVPVRAGRGPRAPAVSAAQRLSPVVRKLVAEHGLDALEIRGSGRGGRITREDVLAFLERRSPHSGPAARPDSAVAPAPAEGDAVVTLNAIRRRTAEHMAASWTTIPHVLQAIEADFSAVERMRRELGAQWKTREGFALTYLPFVARAASLALAKFPRLNASFRNGQLVVHRRINLGIAVDLNLDGLVVPVVKDAPGKSLARIALEIHDLALRARQGRLKPDEVTEGTYTLSNSGVFGTLITAPIINPPQVAILSTDGVRKRPVVIEGPQGDSIAIRPVGVLAQTFDHRAVDGAYSAAFLREVKSVVETCDWSAELSG